LRDGTWIEGSVNEMPYLSVRNPVLCSASRTKTRQGRS
jgi:hypothetical protein